MSKNCFDCWRKAVMARRCWACGSSDGLSYFYADDWMRSLYREGRLFLSDGIYLCAEHATDPVTEKMGKMHNELAQRERDHGRLHSSRKTRRSGDWSEGFVW